MAQYKVQHGDAKAETVDQEGLDALKAIFGRGINKFTITEVKEAAKPADLQVAEAPAKSKSNKSE